MTIASRAIKMQHDVDPKQGIMLALGDRLAKFKVAHNNILVATYVRPEKTAGGILIPGKSRDEDKYQGKVGLVLAKGPMAFIDDKDTKFHGQDAIPGDWIYYRSADGWELLIGELHCRMLTDTQVRGWLTDPDVIY